MFSLDSDKSPCYIVFFIEGLNFIEYDTGPCTADKIVLQAEKYGTSLVECVSSDFEMDKGLAKYFQKSFKHKELLQQQGMLSDS